MLCLSKAPTVARSVLRKAELLKVALSRLLEGLLLGTSMNAHFPVVSINATAVALLGCAIATAGTFLRSVMQYVASFRRVPDSWILCVA